MSGQERIVVGERRTPAHVTPAVWVWHLPESTRPPQNPDWVLVKCGGGVVLSGGLSKRPRSEVCPDCLAGRRTL